MRIQILATSIETKPTSKGSYQQLEVTFKNLTFNKTESKKIMSFGAGAEAFKMLSAAGTGQQYEVSVVKNDKGYNDWVSVVPALGEPASQPAQTGGKAAPASSAGRSTYETPEERAQRQILIVRQSSLSSAIATLSVGAKAVKPDDVIELAQRYSDFVFNVAPAPDAGPSGFEDLPDFEVN